MMRDLYLTAYRIHKTERPGTGTRSLILLISGAAQLVGGDVQIGCLRYLPILHYPIMLRAPENPVPSVCISPQLNF